MKQTNFSLVLFELISLIVKESGLENDVVMDTTEPKLRHSRVHQTPNLHLYSSGLLLCS